MADVPVVHAAELVPIDDLKPHARNYRTHPDGQVAHLEQSIREHGFYRNVVVAADGTILAGHGIVEAARRVGLEQVPVIRLAVAANDPAAVKVLVGDNGLMGMAAVDDRMLADLLTQIDQTDDLVGLLGTGYTTDDLTTLLASLLVPEFLPVPADEQPRLDVRNPIVCPACGHSFHRV